MPIVSNNTVKVIWAGATPLKPGLNEVSEDAVKAMMGLRVMQHRLKAGELEILGGKGGLADMSGKDAIAAIKEMYDVAALEKIVAEDTRKGVRDAAERQIVLIRETDPETGE